MSSKMVKTEIQSIFFYHIITNKYGVNKLKISSNTSLFIISKLILCA